MYCSWLGVILPHPDQHILTCSLCVFNRVSLAKLVAPVSVELLALRWAMPNEAKKESYIDINVKPVGQHAHKMRPDDLTYF